MPACNSHEGMGRNVFADHIKEIAIKIKDTVAELAAETVQERAIQYQARVQEELYLEEENKAAASGREPDPGPHPLPADKGLSLLKPNEQKDIEYYKDTYGLDLLSFKQGDTAAIEKALKDDHLTYIVDQFSRGGNLPTPINADFSIAKLDSVVGEKGLFESSENAEKKDPTEEVENNEIGESSMMQDVANADAPGLQITAESWKSGTADVFRNEFLPRIPIAARNQLNALKAMRNLLAAHKALLIQTREDVDGIAHDGLEAVNSFDSSCGNGDVDIATVLTVAGGVATIAAGIGGLAAGGSGAALIAAGSSIAGGAISTVSGISEAAEGDSVDLPLGADDLETAVENILSALDKTYADLDDGYETLGDGMGKLVSCMDETGPAFIAPRPGAGDEGPALPDIEQDNAVETLEG